MPGTTRIDQSADGAVVVKEAFGEDVARLRAEADRLRAAAHPGVVRVLSSTGDERSWQLRTVHAGRPLAAGPPLEAQALAAVAAAAATTLADLHGLGIVHGRLAASHILIGQQGRAVLCGFGAGGDATPADDVAALGQILLEVLAGDQAPEPIPERRWSRRRRWDGWARATLLTLADQACAEPASRRPSARRFAAALSAAFDVAATSTGVRDANVVAGEEAGDAAGEDPIEALRRSAVVPSRDARPLPLRAATGVVAIVLGVALIAHSSSSRAPNGQPTMAAPASSGTPARVDTSQPTPRPAAPVGEASPRPHRCPGSACADARIDGNVVTTAAGRFEVGRPGDSVVVGDWDCDGVPTPAVLRPPTGEVFVFPRWSGEAELAVRPVRTVKGALTLEVMGPAESCPVLQVRTRTGVVPITRAATL